MQSTLQQQETISKTDEVNIKDVVFRYLYYWKWFVVSILMTLSLAFIFLRYTEIRFGASASILIKDEKNKQ